MNTTALPTREDFAALLDQSMGAKAQFEGQVVKGTVTAIENDLILRAAPDSHTGCIENETLAEECRLFCVDHNETIATDRAVRDGRLLFDCSDAGLFVGSSHGRLFRRGVKSEHPDEPPEDRGSGTSGSRRLSPRCGACKG